MILLRAGARHMLHHPWQAILALVGVALGVGVVTAVDLANESAQRAFVIAAETVAGKATHQVVGAPAGLPETIYRDLKVRGGIVPMAPVVEGYLTVHGPAARTLRLIGVDPFAERGFRNFGDRFLRDTDLESFIARPATGMLLETTASRLGVAKGGRLPVLVNGVRRNITLCGYIVPGSDVARQGLESVLVTDIATAQELLGSIGRLSRIDLIIPEGAGANELLQKVTSRLPSEASVIPASSKTGSLRQLTRAFRLNLTALSLLALIVGMFLIYNTVTFSVVRRRRLIGLLRAIGVTRRQVFVLLCGEALLLGILGSIAGLVFGALLGGELTRLVIRTINDLYFVLDADSVTLLPGAFLKGGLLGVGATVLAAIPPALEATAAPPRAVISRAAIEARTARLLPFVAAAGVAVIMAGGTLLLAEWTGITGGFAGLFLLIAGYALLVPAGVVLLSRLARPLMSSLFGAIGRLAARGIATALSRTGVATAALVVAVSATIGMGIMVGSFRQTVSNWLKSWLRADVYVTTVGTGSGRNKPPLEPRLVERLAKVAGVAEISLTRRVTLEGGDAPTELLALEVPEHTFYGYRFREGNPAEAWRRFSAGEAVIVSEPYASRHGVGAGGTVSLRTCYGERKFPVAGVYYDYGSDSGVVAISRAAYLRLWHDSSVDGMGAYAAPGVSVPELAERLRSVAGANGVTVLSNRDLREASLSVFDRTFAITEVLRILTVVVAFVGIMSALMAIQLERARELAVLRAVGMTPRQAVGLVCAETGLMGVLAGILSLPLGIIQALVLVHVINRRSFGWTMELSIGSSFLVEAFALAVIASVLGGLYPAWRMALARPATALQEED